MDLPSDVQTVLTQLFEAGEQAVQAGEYETARKTVRTAATVSRNKLPNGTLRAQLLHGCDSVCTALDGNREVHDDLASEYLRAMRRRLPEAG
jgi:hypothetical protein